MNRPTLVVTLFTYSRLEYAKRTLRSTLNRLTYSGDKRVHIASDGESQEYITDLVSVVAERDPTLPVTVSNSCRGGYGANYNAATQITHNLGDVVILALEDDWELVRSFDIDPVVKVLSDGDIGCVRLGYIGYTQELRAKFTARYGYHWLLLDPTSPEPHVFAGGPRLETVGFERNVGPWPEGIECGQTEFIVAHRPQARQNIVWPVDLIHPRGDAWVHIGTEEASNSGLRELRLVK